MFSIFKKKLPIEPFPFHLLETDMHSHLIPAVDDGSPDVQESITLIKGMLDLGYTRLITSSHIMQDMYPNTPETLEKGYQAIRNTWEGDLPLQYGAEYFLDDYVTRLVNKGESLLTISGNKLLVELSFVSRPMGLKDMIFDLQMRGYELILAHPERYAYLHRDPRFYEEIKQTGCTFQCNILSFSGYYGESIREAAEFLVSRDLVDLLGTDLHHQRHLKALQELPFTPALRKLMGGNLLNPQL